VRWRILDSSTPECRANDVGTDHSGLEGSERGILAKKHAVDSDRWASMFHVVKNRIAGILWYQDVLPILEYRLPSCLDQGHRIRAVPVKKTDEVIIG
jgi:hypothetical protein